MNFYKLFYLFSMADKLSSVFLVFAWITLIITIVFGFIALLSDESEKSVEDQKKKPEYRGPALWYKNAQFAARSCLVMSPIFWVLYVSTPTKKEAVLIIAGGYVGNFIQSDSNARQLPSDITRFLRTQINLAAQDNQLDGLIGVVRENAVKDSLMSLTKEDLVKQLLKDK